MTWMGILIFMRELRNELQTGVLIIVLFTFNNDDKINNYKIRFVQ